MTVLNPNLYPLIRILFLIHILGGSIALLIFLVPMLSKKGGKLHIISGKIYVYAMLAVAFMAFPITLWRIFFDSNKSIASKSFSAFLFFIAVLTLSSIWQGIRVLRLKNRKQPDLSLKNTFLSYLLIATAIGSVVIGFQFDNKLLIYFPLVGLLSGFSQIKYWKQTPTLKRHWWYEHMRGMFTACIATITAFLVTAVPRIFPDFNSSSLIIWLAPTIVLVPILHIWTRYYKNRFELAEK